MKLDPAICERARLARDPRFDGRFFIGVRTTGIYCRPICPVPPPRPENVSFYASAAAAAEAGLRPCLRCRPEAAPGTAAWQGSSATVSRALRLIGEGALDGGSVEGLADRLGIGGRQLSRLFRQHLGASPGAVARTRRLHFAKRLIDETALPLTEVALAAGYGSVRRFNDAVRSSYGQSPSGLRARRRGGPPSRVELRLPFREPCDLAGLFAHFAARALPSVERVSAGGAELCSYARSFALPEAGGAPGAFELRVAPDGGALLLGLTAGTSPQSLLPLVERVRRVFDLEAEPCRIDAQLAADPGLAPLVARRPGLRLAGSWSGLEAAVRVVLNQQVSVAAARTLAGRLVERFGAPLDSGIPGVERLFPEAAALAEADGEAIGLTGKRAEALRAVARAVASGGIRFDGSQSAERVREALLSLPGIGPWTADMLAIRALAEPDAFPAGDLGLARALAGPDGRRPSGAELQARAEAWRPWRGYAAAHLWAADAAATPARPRARAGRLSA